MGQRSARHLLVAAASLTLAASFADAASVGVNFRRGSGQELMSPSDVAGFVPQINWNNTSGAAAGNMTNVAGPVAGLLVDDSGAVVDGATIDWFAQGTWSAPNGTADGDRKLFSGYLDNTNAAVPAVVRVQNIPYSHYDVYAYLGSDGNNRSGFVSVADRATVPFSTNSNPFPGYVTAVGGPSTYVKFEGLTGPSLRLMAARNSANVGLHGFQIVERTDPPAPPPVHVTPNQIAYFPFDDGIEDVVNGIPVAPQGDIGLVAGRFGAGAISLDGTRDYLEAAPAPNLLKRTQNIAVSAWVQRNDPNGAEVVSLGDHYGLRINTNGTLHFFFDNNPTGNSWLGLTTDAADASEVIASDGKWHHIVAQKTPTQLEIWVDGVRADGNGSLIPTLLPIDYAGLGNNFFIGAHGNGSTGFDFGGAIDEVRVFDGALSPSEIQSLFLSNVVPEPTVLALLVPAMVLPLARRRRK